MRCISNDITRPHGENECMCGWRMGRSYIDFHRLSVERGLFYRADWIFNCIRFASKKSVLSSSCSLLSFVLCSTTTYIESILHTRDDLWLFCCTGEILHLLKLFQFMLLFYMIHEIFFVDDSIVKSALFRFQFNQDCLPLGI